MNHVVSNHARLFVVIVPSSVQIAFKAWEVAARHFYANPVPWKKRVAGNKRAHFYPVDLPRLHEHWAFPSRPPPNTLDALVKVVGFSLRIHIQQLHREV